MADEGEHVVPGDRIADSRDTIPGPGTYVDADGAVRACVVGTVSRAPATSGGGKDSDVRQGSVSDTRQSSISVELRSRVRASLMPEVGEIVVCKVVRINPRVANVDIVCTAGGAVVLQEACSGIIRKEDIREFDKDSVEMFKSVRPGDVVNARVLSLGDSRSYYLSTAENELGVILAKGISGATMVPLTFQEMQCPRTQSREYRKVALIRDTRAPAAAAAAIVE